MFQRHKYFIAAIAPTLLWGFVVIPFRLLKSSNPTQILGFRILISVVVVSAITLIFRRKTLISDYQHLKNLNKTKRRKQILYVVLSAIAITANWYGFIYAVNAVGARVAGFSYMICPLITALLSVFLLKEKLSPRQWIALVIASLSIITLAQGSLREFLFSGFVALTYAIYFILQKKTLAFDRLNLLGYQLILSALLLLPFSWQFYSNPVQDIHFWQLVTLIAILFTVIPMLMAMYAFVGLPASTLGIIIYLNPLVAFFVAFAYFGEHVNLLQGCAYGLILIAVMVFNSELLSDISLSKPRR